MMARLTLLLVACLSLAVSVARAVEPDEMLPDPALEARARALTKDLRCVVCQNQSVDDSDAPLAKDIRVLVREKIAQGQSDQQVIDFIVSRVLDHLGVENTLMQRYGEPARRRHPEED